jgi:hypothetical protein
MKCTETQPITTPPVNVRPSTQAKLSEEFLIEADAWQSRGFAAMSRCFPNAQNMVTSKRLLNAGSIPNR